MSNIQYLPMDFPGTDEQLQANYRSHDFNNDGRCADCNVRASGTASQWACGTDVPVLVHIDGKSIRDLAQGVLEDVWLQADEALSTEIQREFGRRADVRESTMVGA
jgi:hypothetical protein